MVEHDSPRTHRFRVRPADVAAVGLLALAALVGLLAAPALPESLQVHWTVGDLPYHGVERLATPLALTLVPVIGAISFGLLRVVTLVEPVREAIEEVRWAYDAALVAVVGTVALTQVLLVVLNL